MVEKKLWHEEDDNLQTIIEQEQEDYENYDLENFKGPVQKDNGEPAQNNLDLGRACPFCGGLLKLKEVTDKGNVHLYCKDCRRQMFAEDIDKEDDISDALYRTIPLKSILYWEAFRKERKK